MLGIEHTADHSLVDPKAAGQFGIVKRGISSLWPRVRRSADFDRTMRERAWAHNCDCLTASANNSLRDGGDIEADFHVLSACQGITNSIAA